MQRVVGQHDAGDELEEVDVGRSLLLGADAGERCARVDQAATWVAEARWVIGVALSKVRVAAGASGAVRESGERCDAFSLR
jgi:hypothetical protein